MSVLKLSGPEVWRDPRKRGCFSTARSPAAGPCAGTRGTAWQRDALADGRVRNGRASCSLPGVVLLRGCLSTEIKSRSWAGQGWRSARGLSALFLQLRSCARPCGVKMVHQKKCFSGFFFLRWLAIKEGCSNFVRGEDLRRVFVDFFLLRVVGSAR